MRKYSNIHLCLTIGGKQPIKDIQKRLELGADKISITIAFEKQNIIYEAAKEFGSQCIVVSIDVKKEDGNYNIYTRNGLTKVHKIYQNRLKFSKT